MSFMKIPQWLSIRPICRDDSFELRRLFREQEYRHFADITVELLKQYYHQYRGNTFYKLVRILGFYGIQFSKKLSAYSGPLEEVPDVLSIPSTHWKEDLSSYLKDRNVSLLFHACGIYILKQLHGVPVDSIIKLSDYSLTHEKISSILPAMVSPVREDFFTWDPLLVESCEISNTRSTEGGQTTDETIDQYHLSYQTDQRLSKSVESLNLSVRVSNCLKNANIRNIYELIDMDDNELVSIPNFGSKSLTEIRMKLKNLRRELGLKETPPFKVIENGFLINLDSKEVLTNLNIKVEDLVLSTRSRKCLENKDIRYLWQLASFTERRLQKVQNLGRNSICELKNVLKNVGLAFGMVFTPEQREKIRNYEHRVEQTFLKSWLKNKAEKLAGHSLGFLNDRQKYIVRERVWKVGKKRTLEDIAKHYSLSRERVRQLEKNACNKIKQRYKRELHTIIQHLRQNLERLGKVGNLDELDVDLTDINSQEQVIVNSLVQLTDKAIFIDWDFSLVSSRGENFLFQLCDEIGEAVQEKKRDRIFSWFELEEAVKKIISKHGIFPRQNYQNLIRKFRKKKRVFEIDNFLCFGRIKKQDKIILAFKEFFPQGLDVYKKQDSLIQCLEKSDEKTFKDATPRSILARLTDHPDILLWGRGFFIHKDNVSFDWEVVKDVAAWIITRFEKGYSRFQVDIPFSKFKNELLKGGIPNQYALYTLLRLLKIRRVVQRKFPTIVDREADIDFKEGILDELEDYFFEAKEAVPSSQVKEEFIQRRGWKGYSLQQNLTAHSELIYPWQDQSYIHLKYLPVDYSKLEELIAALHQKLATIQGAYSLKGAKAEMNVLWEQACPNATVRTMIKLIRSAGPEDLQIDHYFISSSESLSEFVSAVAELEEFFLEKGTELNRYDLHEEFCLSRGWSENQFYAAIRKANLFKSGKNTFVHPTTINWNRALSQHVHQILEKYLKERNKNRQPYMRIEELIYEYVLPELPRDIQWTYHLLKSVGEELGEFLFFDDAYIFLDNDFDIEDMDDMIGFLIAYHFELGIAKKKKVEELLWREGILESGRSIPADQFFGESSIQYLEASDEVCLSPTGIEKYGRKI